MQLFEKKKKKKKNQPKVRLGLNKKSSLFYHSVYFCYYLWALLYFLVLLRGKFVMFPNRIWGNQAETQRWTLEIKLKGYRCGVSPPKKEIEVAP